MVKEGALISPGLAIYARFFGRNTESRESIYLPGRFHQYMKFDIFLFVLVILP